VKRKILIHPCIFSVFWFMFLTGTVSAEKVFLVHKKDTVPFPNINYHFELLSLETDTDTLRYDDGVAGFRIVEAGKDSVKLRRPLKYADTSIRWGNNYNRPSDSGVSLADLYYTYFKQYKSRGIRYDQYEYKSFAYKDIRTLEYPTYHGSGDGCVGCMLIPGINVIYIIYATRRWKPRRLDMKKWKFVVDQ
jgi:hypothetical protein